MGDEADRANDHGGDEWLVEKHAKEHDEQELFEKIARMEQLHRDASGADVGATIQCPGCFTRIVKTAYNKKFCNNNCKDRFWNIADDERRARAARIARR